MPVMGAVILPQKEKKERKKKEENQGLNKIRVKKRIVCRRDPVSDQES